VHLKDGCRLRVPLVIGELANDADLISGDAPWLVAVAAGLSLLSGRHVGTRRNRPRIRVGRHLDELPNAIELRVDESGGPFADVAPDAGDASVRPISPGGELRMHR
jgi:hypothetical protein